jgi:GR25 family glycosyltransferase involved in LPS biosynthesis
MHFLLLILTLCYVQGILEAVPEKDVEALVPSLSVTAKKHLESMTADQMDANWNLNDYFGSVFIINLARCPDRLTYIKEQLNGIGCKEFTVFKAIDGRESVSEEVWKKFKLNWAKLDLSTEEGNARFDNQRRGEAGCYLSHYNIIKGVKEKFDKAFKTYQEAIAEKNEDMKKEAYQDLLKYRSVMILEDDIGFGLRDESRVNTSLKGSGKIFYEAISDLPAEWDMFYFMTYCRKETPNEVYKPHLIKVNCGFSAIAYVVNYSMYDRLVKELAAIEDPNCHFVLPVDSLYAKIHSKCRCYAVSPSIAYQKIGMSTINSSFTSEVIQFQPLPPL